jgi:hypothetical protein
MCEDLEDCYRLMCKITEQEAFISGALYKKQSDRIRGNSMRRTSMVRREMTNVHKILVWIPEGKRTLRAWRRWNSNTEMDVTAVRYRYTDCMQLIEHCDKYRVDTAKTP